MIVAFPSYLDSLPEDQAKIGRCRFLIRLAALHYSPDGSVKTLSESLGLHPGTLAGVSNISGELAVKLETVLGRDKFPRELFRPDLFVVEA